MTGRSEAKDHKKSDEPSKNIARWTSALIAFGGLIVAWYLMEMHVQAALGDEVGGALCSAHEALDCQSAARSSFATLFGTPIALLGLSFYAGVILLTLFDRQSLRASSDPFRPAAVVTTLFLASLIYSLFLAGVSAFHLQSFCPFCVMLYVVNAFGLVTASMWAGQNPWALLLSQLKQPRGVLSGWTMLFVVGFGFTFLIGSQTMETALRDRSIEQNLQTQRESQKRYDPAQYRIGDAPALGPADAPVHIVTFSNFPCPHCARFAPLLEVLHGEFPDDLRIEYRYFPLATQEFGNLTSRAAHCADEQDAFWPMHDLLFEQAPEHAPEEVSRYAATLRLDEAAFQQCLDSDRARARIDIDVAAANALGVDATPTFFINGKKLSGVYPLDMMRRLVEEDLAIATQESEPFPRD